jgi:hypothetical protein
MNNRSTSAMDTKYIFGTIVSCTFGLLAMAIGLVNIFWGNDLGFGICIFLLSLVYFPPANTIIKKVTGFSIPLIVKILLAIFILWASLGVGELFSKIEMMRNSF